MILFVFEGKRREVEFFKTIEYLFFPNTEEIFVYSFENNIYNLYKILTATGEPQDIVSVLRELNANKTDNPFTQYNRTSDFSEVYLFFDYDIHNQNIDETLSIEELNKRLLELLNFFDNETENGKLYINYPMIESIRYTKTLPDKNYDSYEINICFLENFKRIVNDFSDYGNLDFISFRFSKKTQRLIIPNEEHINEIKRNWEFLKIQNVHKANYICTNVSNLPQKKENISPKKIFDAQLKSFVSSKKSVSILNAFPIFLYDYLK